MADPTVLDSLRAKQEATDAEKRAVLTALARKTFLSATMPCFCDHVWVQDPITKRVDRFEKWAHLLLLATVLKIRRLIIIGKDRQVGISWCIAAYAYWIAMGGNAVVALISQGGDEAQKLLGKVRFIHEHLPRYLQLEIDGEWSTEKVKFKNGSSVQAYPSTAKAGRSITGSLVIFDEADHHEYLGENYAAISPAIDMGALYEVAGEQALGQLIMISTVNPETVQSTFKKLLKGARDYEPAIVA